MPQVDLETLVTACAGGGNDRKIACETLADDDPPQNNVIPDEEDAAEAPPDFPPESFWLSKDAEYDWFDRNAFYERKESTKANSTSNQHVNPNSNSSSQRFSVSLKSKASILGLPKTQKTAFVESKRRVCTKPANIRLFPKRSESSVGKPTAPVAEPGSPKVSCMGRVRSKRGRRRSNSLRRNEKPAEKPKTSGDKTKTGLYSKVMNLFRSKKGKKKPSRSGSRRVMEILMEEPVDVEPQRKSVSVRVREIPAGGEPMADPPGLGGITRFASGRRSGSWTAEDLNQAEVDRRQAGRN
ncbi:hypothetical protein C2S52_019621 [Perilla frutescens var. hirtella]|nr:hypothetical protein C2S52_019621 [Perilla frutescens var. hirtella]KAH6806125.1 hypothetical protein C2S51_030956 [Perilla frutescens var. frutescens]